jgi:hypothetical protein
LERLWLSQLVDWSLVKQSRELLVVFRKLGGRDAEDAAVEFRSIGWLRDALLELNVFVPEGVALEVKADEMGAALEEPVLSVSLSWTARSFKEIFSV